MTPPLYTALLGGALLVLQIGLMLSVGLRRNAVGKGVGVDGDMTLERLVRRHGNLAENAAIFIAVLAIYELLVGQTMLVLIIGALFFTARLMHVIGFSNDTGSHLVEGGGKAYVMLRAGGAGFTALSSLILGGAVIYSAAMAL